MGNTIAENLFLSEWHQTLFTVSKPGTNVKYRLDQSEGRKWLLWKQLVAYFTLFGSRDKDGLRMLGGLAVPDKVCEGNWLMKGSKKPDFSYLGAAADVTLKGLFRWQNMLRINVDVLVVFLAPEPPITKHFYGFKVSKALSLLGFLRAFDVCYGKVKIKALLLWKPVQFLWE